MLLKFIQFNKYLFLGHVIAAMDDKKISRSCFLFQIREIRVAHHQPWWEVEHEPQKTLTLVCGGLMEEKQSPQDGGDPTYVFQPHLYILGNNACPSLSRTLKWGRKKSGCSYLSGSWMGSTPLPAMHCSLWADHSLTAVKTVKRKRQVTEGERVVEQCQLSSKTLWTAGPRDATPQSLAWCCVWCYSQEQVQLLVQLLLVWNPRKMSAAADVNMYIMWPACIVSQTPTSCCLTNTPILPLNDLSKRMCFIFFSNWHLLFFSRKKMYG